MQRRVVAILASVVMASVSLLGQAVDPALMAAIGARQQASDAREAAGLDRYTASDYAAISPAGVLVDKKQRMDSPSGMPVEGVRVYGSSAVVRS
jgi:hypothetical protein